METSSDRDYQDRRVGPTVSKEKWLNHARQKLLKGYVLIVGKERKTANFYLRNKGFEMCPYNVAKQMVKDGLLVEAGEHHLGTMYRLADHVAQPEPTPRRKREVEEVVEDEVILVETTDDNDEPADEETDVEEEEEEEDEDDDLDEE